MLYSVKHLINLIENHLIIDRKWVFWTLCTRIVIRIVGSKTDIQQAFCCT